MLASRIACKHLEAHCRHNGYPFTGITVDDAPVNHSAEVRDFLLEKASNLSIGAAMEHRGKSRRRGDSEARRRQSVAWACPA